MQIRNHNQPLRLSPVDREGCVFVLSWSTPTPNQRCGVKWLYVIASFPNEAWRNKNGSFFELVHLDFYLKYKNILTYLYKCRWSKSQHFISLFTICVFMSRPSFSTSRGLWTVEVVVCRWVYSPAVITLDQKTAEERWEWNKTVGFHLRQWKTYHSNVLVRLICTNPTFTPDSCSDVVFNGWSDRRNQVKQQFKQQFRTDITGTRHWVKCCWNRPAEGHGWRSQLRKPPRMMGNVS